MSGEWVRKTRTGGGIARSAAARVGIALELVAAEGPALEHVADRIGRQLHLAGQRALQMIFGAALRAVAESERGRVVPPAPRVVGGAVDDLVAQLRMLEPDADELHEIVRPDPDRHAAHVERFVAEIADADAEDAE